MAAASEAAAHAVDSTSDPAYAEFAIVQLTGEGPQEGEPWIIADRYRVEEPIGEGGMGRVYRVRHRQLGKPFALKLMQTAFSGDSRARDHRRSTHRLAFFDGPGGTQVPDEVVDAIARYLRETSANVSNPYETAQRTGALVAQAQLTAADFLGCTPDETIFGANITTLNFALTRAAGARALARRRDRRHPP